MNDSLSSLDLQILDKESNNDVAAEIGPLRYLDKLTGWGMDRIVNWFTLLIVLVFDPLAISMVIALNKLVKEVKIEETKPTEEKLIKQEMVVEEPNKTVEETIIENVEAKEEKPDVVFEPTTEEALNLYNEEPKPKPKPTPQPPTHTYARTGADRYR